MTNTNELHKIDTLKDEEILKIMEDLSIDEDMLPQFKAYASNYLYTADLGHFEESYAGEYDSDKDFAMELADELGIEIKNEWPHNCIDWDQAARDIMYDYFEADGYYFRNI